MGKKTHGHSSPQEQPWPQAGCLAGDLMRSGDENSDCIISPEEKAADTKGYLLVGKITLDQYLTLEAHGYKGDVIRRWTKYHADKEICRRNLAPTTIIKSPARHERGQDQQQPTQGYSNWPVCPACKAKVKTVERLKEHLVRVHRMDGPAATEELLPHDRTLDSPPHATLQRSGQNDPLVRDPSRICTLFTPSKTAPGAYWDARLWLPPTTVDQRRASAAGGQTRRPKYTKLPPGLGVQYCTDRQWRTTRGIQSDISLSQAAVLLRVPEPDLIEWVRKVDVWRTAPLTPPPMQ